MQALINALEAARLGEGKIMKVSYKEGSRYFWIHGTLSEPGKDSIMCICERLHEVLHLNVCSTCVKNHISYSCACDNYIPACQANPSKVTIRNFSCWKIRMACENRVASGCF